MNLSDRPRGGRLAAAINRDMVKHVNALVTDDKNDYCKSVKSFR